MKEKTIYDIAREANVGIATVSRVLNHKGYVSAATRAKIEACMEGYVPSAPRKKKEAPVKAICLAIPHEPSYFFINSTYLNAMLGISVVLQKRGYRMMLDISADDNACIELFQSKMVDGIILMGTKTSSELIETMLKKKIPFVLIGDYLKSTEQPYCKIDIDDLDMARQAVRHLIVLGHRRIGFIGGSVEFASCENRIHGYQAALDEAGLPRNREYIATCDSISDEKAYQLAKKLLYQRDRVTAILAFNDMVAGAIYRAAREMGLEIPRDLSVIGFDDSDLSRYISPPLTTVSQPSYEKGFKAASMLIDGLENPAVLKETVHLEGMIIYRESCASPFEDGEEA